jgi:hypothetical protein
VTSPPVKTALMIQRGTTWSAYFPVFDPDAPTMPLDLTGWTARAQIRAWYGASLALFSWPEDADIECTVEGRVYIHVEPEQSTAWTWDRGVYGVELSDPDLNVTALAQGPVLVIPEVVI